MVYSAVAEGKPDRVDNEIVRRLIWSGLLAATGAVASIVAARASSLIYRRIFNEDPPD